LTTKNEILINENNQLLNCKNQLMELSHRYNTALELVGEKTEEVEEARADLQDMKQLYRTQVSDLLQQIEFFKSLKQ